MLFSPRTRLRDQARVQVHDVREGMVHLPGSEPWHQHATASAFRRGGGPTSTHRSLRKLWFTSSQAEKCGFFTFLGLDNHCHSPRNPGDKYHKNGKVKCCTKIDQPEAGLVTDEIFLFQGAADTPCGEENKSTEPLNAGTEST